MTSIRRRLFPFQMKWAKDDGFIGRFLRCLSWNCFSGDFSLRIGFPWDDFLTIRSPTIWDRVPLFQQKSHDQLKKHTSWNIRNGVSYIFSNNLLRFKQRFKLVTWGSLVSPCHNRERFGNFAWGLYIPSPCDPNRDHLKEFMDAVVERCRSLAPEELKIQTAEFTPARCWKFVSNPR